MELLADYHKHQCKFCHFTWQHHDINDVQHGGEGGHECPSCHRCNWGLGVYEGPDEPEVVNARVPMAGTTGVYQRHPDQGPA